jgi:hypothetical protein
MNELSLLRQYLAEQPEGKMFSADELWEIIKVFSPLLNVKQEKEFIAKLKKRKITEVSFDILRIPSCSA